MALDEETYELIDEYLVSAVEILKQMYKEHGEKILTTEDFDEYFDEFRDRTYELTEVISDSDLEMFKNYYMKKFNEALQGEVTPIAIVKKDYAGQLEYHLQVSDTLIIMHKRGRRVDKWGSTPSHIKSIINDIVLK